MHLLISDPRKSAPKHALCIALPKEFPLQQNRTKYPAGFYVKGNIQRHYFKMVRLVKLKDGSFLFPVPTDIRVKLGLQIGELINLDINKDRLYHGMDTDFIKSFFQETDEVRHFYAFLTYMQKHRYHEWIATAPTNNARLDRTVATLEALRNKHTFKQMKAAQRQQKEVMAFAMA